MSDKSQKTLTEDDISSQWPLHWLVWNDDHMALNRLLDLKVYDKESRDPRGRTPLHLAVTLKRKKCAEVLLYHGADALALNRHQWSVLHEAVSTGDTELCGMVLAVRDKQQIDASSKEVPMMLEKLQSSPDFYIEMKWEFTTWVPFLSRLCPSDTYKIWKKGPTVRVDTTLVGFQNLQWLRGNISFVFQITAGGATFAEINHDRCTILENPIIFQHPQGMLDPYQQMANHDLAVMRRLKSPIVSTVFSSDTVSFDRQKAGVWGFRSDKTENINGYNAKVFNVTGFNIITRTRVDHLPDDEKEKQKNAGNNPLGILGISEEEMSTSELEVPSGGRPAAGRLLPGGSSAVEGNDPNKGQQLSLFEYFTPPSDPKKYDCIGSNVEVHTRTQILKASTWLCEDYPLSLHDQILPIIELMSLNNAHFAKLKDFVTLQMPSGFPVKFEIPLFHVMSARVTFDNVNGLTNPVPHVSLESREVTADQEEILTTPFTTPISTSKAYRRHGSGSDVGTSVDPPTPTDTAPPTSTKTIETCRINDEIFAYPAGYSRNSQYGGNVADQEEELIQLAIRQSLLDQGERLESLDKEMTLVEALKDQEIRDQTQRDNHQRMGGNDDISLAMALSQVQATEDERLRQQEEEELERVLRLSMIDK